MEWLTPPADRGRGQTWGMPDPDDNNILPASRTVLIDLVADTGARSFDYIYHSGRRLAPHREDRDADALRSGCRLSLVARGYRLLPTRGLRRALGLPGHARCAPRSQASASRRARRADGFRLRPRCHRQCQPGKGGRGVGQRLRPARSRASPNRESVRGETRDCSEPAELGIYDQSSR